MTARWITADVFDGLATLETGSVDLVVTSPPFLALRSYLPADHPDKHKEIGSEATPAEFIDVLLRVTAELRRVLAPHGSICVELGDTYAGSGGAGGDYDPGGFRDGQPGFRGSGQTPAGRIVDTNEKYERVRGEGYRQGLPNLNHKKQGGGAGWPLSKSRTLIPQLYEIALAYGINPLTGSSSPAGQWRIRNVVTWARPNPPVGALGDKWRPATSDLIVACVSPKRYWDDLATRKPHQNGRDQRPVQVTTNHGGNKESRKDHGEAFYSAGNASGAPLLDYWEIPPGGYKGSHYAVFPEELVVPCVKAMCPEKVCRTCGEPSRRIVEKSPEYAAVREAIGGFKVGHDEATGLNGTTQYHEGLHIERANLVTTGWSDCGHDDYRPGLVLDPFAGSGTTLSVATGHGHDAIGIDLDPRNADLARDRIGPFLFEQVTV